MQAVIHKELRETVKKGKERKLTLHSVRETISGKTLENPAWKGLIYFFRDNLQHRSGSRLWRSGPYWASCSATV